MASLAHSQLDIDLISEIKDIIETNLGSPDLTPAFLSSELALSSSKLYRKITELTDMSPNEFIRTIPLKKAASLLKTRNYNVSEVANSVGSMIRSTSADDLKSNLVVHQGAVIWIFIAEIFPNKVRAYGQDWGSGTHWVFAALITLSGSVLINTFEPWVAFAFFGCFMILQLLFIL